MLAQEPEDLFLNYATGIEYAAELNLDAAETSFKKVLELNAGYIPAFYQLGKLCELRLNIPEALRHYRSGLEQAILKKDHKAVNEFGEAIFMLED